MAVINQINLKQKSHKSFVHEKYIFIKIVVFHTETYWKHTNILVILFILFFFSLLFIWIIIKIIVCCKNLRNKVIILFFIIVKFLKNVVLMFVIWMTIDELLYCKQFCTIWLILLILRTWTNGHQQTKKYFHKYYFFEYTCMTSGC